MARIIGFEQLSKDLKDAQKAISELDGRICDVSLDPHDPGSIEAAIDQINATIDDKVGRYADNPLVKPLIDGLKETCREHVLSKAAAARLGGKADE